ncbi:MAG: hypothetical protein B6D61_14440 [Bacteroidetes bacterium 4484_249]|nr:MAG: hypothetical protein B6D61_14440 [Bacteroidetes bacterium 4484_249]
MLKTENSKPIITSKFILLFFPMLLISITACTNKPVEVIEQTYDDGTPKTVRYYKSESKEVLLKEILYYEDGQKKMEGAFKKDERTGQWSYWYPDGKLWSQGVYKDGKENGLKTVWHENGQKYYEGKLDDGKRIGVWKFWGKDGKLLKEVDYDKE